MEQSFFLSPITSEDIIHTVSEFESNKASGHDNISPKVIKKLFPKLLTSFQPSSINHSQVAS